MPTKIISVSIKEDDLEFIKSRNDSPTMLLRKKILEEKIREAKMRMLR